MTIKKQKISFDLPPPIVETPLESTINNIVTNNDTPKNSEIMDIDPTTAFSENNNNVLPSPTKQTTNDSMHASSSSNPNNNNNNQNITPPIVSLPITNKGKQKQTWSEEMDDKDDETRDQEDNTTSFNIITAPTHFYATDNVSDIKGNSIAEKRTAINSLFIHYDGYQGSTYISKMRKFFVYFNTMDSLKHALTKSQETQHNPVFTIVDPAVKQQKQDAEKGRTIKVADIPLFTKSDVVRNYFAKYGKISRFSMIIRGPWQIAFIVYEDPKSIAQFYDHVWFVSFLENFLRVEPTDLDPMQTALRQQFELKLTGLPFNTDQ